MALTQQKGVNMNKEWKVCNVKTAHIADGEPQSARCCAIALAMEEIVGKSSKYKSYSPVISNASDMFLDRATLDDNEYLEDKVIGIEVFNDDRDNVDEFIEYFDMTYDDESLPLPGPISFRYKILDRKETTKFLTERKETK